MDWTLLGLCIAFIVNFRTAERLAGAYGVAAASTMGITTILLHLFMRQRWNWSARRGTVAVHGHGGVPSPPRQVGPARIALDVGFRC